MTPNQVAELAFRLAVAAREISADMDLVPSDFKISVDVLMLDPATFVDITVIPAKKEVIDAQDSCS